MSQSTNTWPATCDDPLAVDLLARVDAIADVLAATSGESDQLRRLAPTAVQALRDAGLYSMKVPASVGGLGATPATQMRVLSRLAEIDTASAWNIMVANNSAAFMASFLPDDPFAEVFAEGIPIAAGVAPPYGTATEVDGGYRVTGRFRLCSGVHQAFWVRLRTMLPTGNDAVRPLFFVVPKGELTIIDNWDTLGLRGSGSPDVELQDAFVPSNRAFFEEVNHRGGPQQRLRGLEASAYEHTAIAIGIASRALREVVEVAQRRASINESHLNQLGRLKLQLDATTAYGWHVFQQNDRLLSDPHVDPSTIGRDNMAISTFATDLAIECVEFAYRFAGSVALYLPNIVEKLLRDVHAAAQHVGVQHNHYTDLARRGRIGVMKYLVLAVFVLGAPYLYGELFPLNNGFVAMLLQMAIGTCAAIVLCDVGWFVYSHYGRHDRDQA